MVVDDREFLDDVIFTSVWLAFHTYVTYHVFALWRKLNLQKNGCFRGYAALQAHKPAVHLQVRRWGALLCGDCPGWQPIPTLPVVLLLMLLLLLLPALLLWLSRLGLLKPSLLLLLLLLLPLLPLP